MSATIHIDHDVPMAMRDGVILRADIYRPANGGKCPAILMRTPYGKHIKKPLELLEYVEAGYAVAIQDVRGRYASDGEWNRANMLAVEGVDGYDSVESIAAQPWCDGSVGMMGISYLSGLQWFAAMEQPPHLKAIAPGMGGMRTVGIGMTPVRSGGAVSLAVALSRIPLNGRDVLDRLERQGQDVTAFRQALEWTDANPEQAFNFLPLKDLPLLQLPALQALWQLGIHTVPEQELAQRCRYERVQVPCFHHAGWYDVLEYSQFDSFVEMQRRGGTPLAREGQFILVGPWAHGSALTTSLGGINFGPQALPQPSLAQRHIEFFDHYLRGTVSEIPHVTYFLMGQNCWRTAEAWPLPQTEWRRMYLHSQGHANTSAGDGTLSPTEPQDETADRYVYNPLRPVPSVGGRITGNLIAGPLDQVTVARRSDVLCYTTPELESDVEVTGLLELHLFAATSVRDTDFTAKLVDLYPDGRAYNLAEGILRASGLHSIAAPEPVIPGEVNEYVVTLGDTSNLFRRGHRIRLEVTSSNFPLYDRNMNTGNAIGEDATGIPALQSIFHHAGRASYIDLPVIPS